MSRIENLIKEKCPNGVEYLELYKVIKWNKKFSGVNKEWQLQTIVIKTDISSQELKSLNLYSGDIKLLSTGYFDGYTDSSIYTGLVDDLEVITIPSGGRANIKYYNGKFINSGNIIGTSIDSNKFYLKYIYYCLLNKNDLIQSYFRGSSVQHPDMKQIIRIRIPIPPLEIQKEIANLLDKFGELEAELEARKSQYEFWRGKLLENDYEECSINSLCLKIDNINWNKESSDFQYIDLSSVNRENNKIEETASINSSNAPSRAKQVVNTNDILFGTTRPMLKRITIVSEEYNNQICSTGYCVLRPNVNKILPEWLYFNLQTKKYYEYVESFQQGASYPSISDTVVKNYMITVPPIEQQRKIIDVLNKFDRLINDISVGLPAEIELRRQQYEYYKNKLLSFKELSVGE